MRRGLRGLGDCLRLVDHLVETGVVKLGVLQVRLFAKPDVDRDHLYVEFLLPGWRHVRRSIGHDPQHDSVALWLLGLRAQIVPQCKQRAMIEAFDGSFASPHDLTNLGVRKVFDELQDQQGLPVGGQPPYVAQ